MARCSREISLAAVFGVSLLGLYSVCLLAVSHALLNHLSDSFRVQLEVATTAALLVGTAGPVCLLFAAAVCYAVISWWRDKRVVAGPAKQFWQHSREWAEGRSGHDLLGKALLWVTLGLSINSMVFGALATVALQESPPWEAVFILPFVFVALGVAIKAAMCLWEAYVFRDVLCELVQPPFAPGDAVRCYIDWNGRMPPASLLAFELECTTSRTEPRTYDEADHYEFSHYMTRHAMLYPLDSDRIALRFPLPDDAPTTSRESGFRWTLAARWMGKYSWVHRIAFDIPVCTITGAQESTETSFGFDEQCCAASGLSLIARAESLKEIVAGHGGVVSLSPSAIDGEELSWGLRISAGKLPGWIAKLTSRQRLECATVGITFSYRLLLPRSQRHVGWSEVQTISACQAKSSIFGVGLHEIVAQMHSGERVVLLHDAHSRVLARVLCSYLEKARAKFTGDGA